MKTFKFLALSLLVATAGLYSSVNIAEAAEASDNVDNNKKLMEKFKEFRGELFKQTGTKSLQDISKESGLSVNFLRECITIRLPLMKKIETIYNIISPANRTLQNVNEKLNKLLNYKYSEQFVARCLKALGYDYVRIN